MRIGLAGVIAAASTAWAGTASPLGTEEWLISAPEDPTLFGVQGNDMSDGCDISGSGRYVVFRSDATQLVAGDTNARGDVFIRDRSDGTTQRVNHDAGGAQNARGANSPTISTGGRYVALASEDALHDPALGPLSSRQAFRIDRDTGEVRLVSRTTSGTPSFGGVYEPVISGNGRYVAFTSSDTRYDDAGNGLRQVFRWDAQTDQVRLVSAHASGVAAASASSAPSISNSGRYVAFTTNAGNLVPGDDNGLVDVFVKDMDTGAIERVSVDSGGNPSATSGSFAPVIAGNGSAVVFESADPGLVAGDTNGATDVFVHFMSSGETRRASVDGTGAQLAGGGFSGSIDTLGQGVLFASRDAALAGASGYLQLAHLDLASGTVQVLTGAQAADTRRARLAGGGGSACFDSESNDLVAGDANGYADVFTASIGTGGAIELASRAGEPVAQPSANAGSYNPALDADGSHVVFASEAALDLETYAQAGGRAPMQVYVAREGRIDRVSNGIGGVPANGESGYPRIDAAGRYVAYESIATNLAVGDDNGVFDVFRHDLQTGETRRISLNDGYPGIGAWGASISDDGMRVAFLSDGDGYVAGDGNESTDVFVWDAASGVRRVNLGPAGVEADGGESYRAEISGNGRFVAFDSYADNLVPGDGNGTSDVFVRDLDAGTTERVSVSAGGEEAKASAQEPSISRDGRYVAFVSNADNLVPPDTVRASDVFLVDRQQHTIARITDAFDGGQGADFTVGVPRVTPDGSRVFFFAWRAWSGPVVLVVYDIHVDRLNARIPATSDAYVPDTLATNADGSLVALDWGQPLVDADVNGLPDVYVLATPTTDTIFVDGFDLVQP